MRDVNRNADRTGCFAQNSKALGNAGCVSKMDRTKKSSSKQQKFPVKKKSLQFRKFYLY